MDQSRLNTGVLMSCMAAAFAHGHRPLEEHVKLPCSGFSSSGVTRSVYIVSMPVYSKDATYRTPSRPISKARFLHNQEAENTDGLV